MISLPAPSQPLFADDYTVATPPETVPASPTDKALDPDSEPPSMTLSPPSRSTSLQIATLTPLQTGNRNRSQSSASGGISPTSIMTSSGLIMSLQAATGSTSSLLSTRSLPSPSQSQLNRRPSTPTTTPGSGLADSTSSSIPPHSPTDLMSSTASKRSSGPMPQTSPSASRTAQYDTFESCMEGGIKHETQSAACGHKGEAAANHLVRAGALFASALRYKPSSAWATLRRATVLLHLSTHTPSSVAIEHLRQARSLLVGLTVGTPHSMSAREELAAVCTRLSCLLHAREDAADDPVEVWEGEVGRFACEALEALEEVAAERMDRARTLRRDAFEGEAPALADMFITLAQSAGAVAALATDADTVDEHAELAEHALDQAANMATVAAAAKVRPATVSAALITRVQLASGRAAAERLRNTFLLGVAVDEDDFAALIADMTLLVNETRERAARLKGSKGAAAASQAFEAVRQLGDTKVLYANILRCVWRGRRNSLPGHLPSEPSTPLTPGLSRANSLTGVPSLDRSRPSSLSGSSVSIESPPIPELPEPGDEVDAGVAVVLSPASKTVVSSSPVNALAPVAPPKRTGRAPPPPPLQLNRPPPLPLPPLPPLNSAVLFPPAPRTPLSPLNPSSVGGLARRTSDLHNGSQRPRLARATTSFSNHLPSPRWHSPISPAGSPGPAPTLPLPSPPRRRLSSMSRPLNAWERRPSYQTTPTLVSLASANSYASISDDAQYGELARTAWTMLGGALKHYKLALTLLSQSDAGERARAKSEVLAAIAAASLFRAALGPRLSHMHSVHNHAHPVAPSEKDGPAALLSTAEVYATWAAREVGWSFLIEGTKEAEAADHRTGSWQADEAGKRAVLLTLRVWWLRATAEPSSSSSEDDGDGDGVSAAKTDGERQVIKEAKASVEAVVKRLRDLEGVDYGDVARFAAHIYKNEGDMDPAETLFWRSVKRILRGGDGYVLPP